MPRFARIECNCPSRHRPTWMTEKGLHYHNYLGDVQLDTPNTARHYCKNCKTLYEHNVDDAERVTRTIIKSKIPYTETVAIL